MMERAGRRHRTILAPPDLPEQRISVVRLIRVRTHPCDGAVTASQLPEDPVIVDKLQDLFRRLFSDPEQAERFAEDPDAVLAEAGIDCEVADLADALPLAVAALPAEQAAAVLERCGPVESWTGLTVSTVLTRVTVEPVPAATWVDQVDEPVVDPIPVHQPPTAEEPPAAHEPQEAPAADEPVAPGDSAPAPHDPPAAAAAEPKAPAEEPPTAHEPPAEDPPAEKPPAEEPPTAHEPPTEQPPAEEPPTAHEPPAEEPPTEDPPAEDPPAEQPPVVADPPVVAVPPTPPSGEVLLPPDEPPAREFVDIKEAIESARAAIRDGDTVALAEALESARPEDRVLIAEGLREELLVRGAAEDDPVVATLDEALVGAAREADDADAAEWFSFDSLPPLAFDATRYIIDKINNATIKTDSNKS
jgi:hypothetical protein